MPLIPRRRPSAELRQRRRQDLRAPPSTHLRPHRPGPPATPAGDTGGARHDQSARRPAGADRAAGARWSRSRARSSATGANATPPASAEPSGDAARDDHGRAARSRSRCTSRCATCRRSCCCPGSKPCRRTRVLGLQTNRRFVEAYMVGLNHEMGRELLWRGFPTDQRGTCFDQFWDTRGAPAAARPTSSRCTTGAPRRSASRELPPARRAVRDADAQRAAAPLPQRGDLRDAGASCVNGARQPERRLGRRSASGVPRLDAARRLLLRLRPHRTRHGDVGTIPDGTRRAKPGYYIVIQEQPTEPRFGLDVGHAGGRRHPPERQRRRAGGQSRSTAWSGAATRRTWPASRASCRCASRSTRRGSCPDRRAMPIS